MITVVDSFLSTNFSENVGYLGEFYILNLCAQLSCSKFSGIVISINNIFSTDKAMLHLIIITPDEEIFNGDVEQAGFPGSDGSFQVLNNHAPLVSVLAQGNIHYTKDKQRQTLPIAGGVVEVHNNVVTVLIMPTPVY